jgi:radical SAM protein
MTSAAAAELAARRGMIDARPDEIEDRASRAAQGLRGQRKARVQPRAGRVGSGFQRRNRRASPSSPAVTRRHDSSLGVGMNHVFAAAPQRIYWEMTRACDLACRHCRAEAQACRAPGELDTAEAMRVIDQIAAVSGPRPHLIFTGGDPFKRPDLMDLVAHAVAAGLPVSVSPAVTPLLTGAALRALRAAGVEAISLSLDGSDAARHDGLRRVPGTFARTLEAMRDAVDAGLLVQVNTLVTADTLSDLPAIDALVSDLGAQRWSLFFLVTVGRGKELGQITPADCEALFAWVRERSQRRGGPIVTTTEAPHYRRVLLESQRGTARAAAEPAAAAPHGHGGLGAQPGSPGEAPIVHRGRAGFGIRDGNGIMFISYCGEVCPSGFLPLVAGNVRESNPIDVYRFSPLFQSLRDPDGFEGKCGYCEYRHVCGGSRARAFAATGSPLGTDPLCAYEPARRARAEGSPADAGLYPTS